MGKQIDNDAAAGNWNEAPVNLDAIDRLTMKLAHVDAMLATICGDGFDSFNGWSDEIRGNFLWGCSQIVSECREAAGAIVRP